MANPVQRFLRRSQRTWLLLAQSGVWVAGAVVGFLVPPPVGTPDESQIWVRFAQFAITVVIGLMLLVALRWKRKKDAFGWAWISALFLFLGTASFFGYQLFAARWTAWYHNGPVLIGGVYTPDGREYHERNPNLTSEDLLMHHRGELEKVWTRASVQQRRLLLAAMYVLAMPLFTVCIMSIVQALHCASTNPSKRKRGASPVARTAP
ncbi:MAG: hypothetical protein L0Z50_29365 [Verrucomicrobiales bacterium]|nr:hypothetical protein [Verrucomicrobiales bacterium]